MKTQFDNGRDALEKLMVDAEMTTHFYMRHLGRCPTTLLMKGPEGTHVMKADNLTGEQSKDQFATTARLLCLAEGAEATVFLSESWMLMAKDDKPLDLGKLPSQCPDRQEVVTLMGEYRGGYLHKFLPIMRGENGKFAGFGESPEMKSVEIKGRFAELLSPTPPDEQMRREARRMLEHQGVVRHQSEDEDQQMGWRR